MNNLKIEASLLCDWNRTKDPPVRENERKVIAVGRKCVGDVEGASEKDFVVRVLIRDGVLEKIDYGKNSKGVTFGRDEIVKVINRLDYVQSREDGRSTQAFYLSTIVSIDRTQNNIDISNNFLLLVDEDDDIKKIDVNIKKRKKLRQDGDKTIPKAVFIPFTSQEHRVCFVVDVEYYPQKGSVKCFDSSHYFCKCCGFGSKFDLNQMLGDGKNVDFKKAVDDYPLNKRTLQWGQKGTCSHWTESFINIVSKEYLTINNSEEHPLQCIERITQEKIENIKKRKRELYDLRSSDPSFSLLSAYESSQKIDNSSTTSSSSIASGSNQVFSNVDDTEQIIEFFGEKSKKFKKNPSKINLIIEGKTNPQPTPSSSCDNDILLPLSSCRVSENSSSTLSSPPPSSQVSSLLVDVVRNNSKKG
jgi:hypothetical protein